MFLSVIRRFSVILLALLLIFSLFGCKKNEEIISNSKPSESDIHSSVVSDDKEIKNDGSSSSNINNAETSVNESKEEIFDTLPFGIRDFLALASKYNTDDYSYSVKTQYIKNNLFPEPVNLSWICEDFNNALAAKIAVATKRDFSDARVIDYKFRDILKNASSSGCITTSVYNLIPGIKYYWRTAVSYDGDKVKSTPVSSFSVVDGIRLINLDGVENCRDLGGWKTDSGSFVKFGRVYRAAKLENITDKGLTEFSQVLGIKTEIDLRNLNEVYSAGSNGISSCCGSNVLYNHISSLGYGEYLRNQKPAKNVFSIFADIDNYPIIFHCAVGADRTGTLAFMLNALLGVGENDLVADYELTKGRERTNTSFSSFVADFKGLDGATFKDKAYNFYHNMCGMTAMQLSNIRNIMLTDSAVFESASLDVQTVKENDGVSFGLRMRSSFKVDEVTFNGQPTAFDFSGSTLTVNGLQGIGQGTGVIVFNDGQRLEFEVNIV